MKTNSINIRKLTLMAILSAIAVILTVFKTPIFPVVAFLEYEAADVPIFFGTYLLGPVSGIIMTVVVSVIQCFTVSAEAGIIGGIMHILATGFYCLVFGLITRKNKSTKRTVLGMTLGAITMIVVMIFWNLLITPIYMKVPLSGVIAVMPFIFLFNVIKAGANSIFAFILIKILSTRSIKILKGENYSEEKIRNNSR